MIVLLLIAVGLLAMPSTLANAVAPAPAGGLQARRVGEKFEYSLNAVMSQSIAGRDAFGRLIHQELAPTNVKGHESIAVTKMTAEGVTLRRSGTVTAVVDGAPPQTKFGQGWTLVDTAGKVVRDSGKLGGLFLLPLPFLGAGAVKAGDDLTIGDHWSGKLGTKLYGMVAQPMLEFTVSGVRSVLGVNVFTIEAVGTVPMKEPVMTSNGEPLGYATGVAHINAEFDYDRDNHRLIEMQAEVNDTLHYAGPSKRNGGSVRDSQKCIVALDAVSINGGLPGAVAPAGPPQ